jgi:uncharacterized protein YcgL (UPF0745 family)
VFRSRRNPDTYLFVDHAEGFARVPQELLDRMGGTERAMTLVLEPGRKLARATAAEVLGAIDSQGFFLQLPPPSESPPGANRC